MPRTSAASSPASTRRRGCTTARPGCTRAARSPPPAGVREHATQAFEQKTGAGMLVGEVPRDDTLQHPRCVFQILRRHFSRYTPETVERICGISQEDFHAVAEALIENSGPRAHDRLLLRGGMDAAQRGRADDPHGGHPPAPAREHRPPRGRDPRAARPRVDPGLDGHPDALRPAPGIPAHAARGGGGAGSRALHRHRRRRPRLVVVLPRPTSCRCSRPGSATRRPRKTATASRRSRGSAATTRISRR